MEKNLSLSSRIEDVRSAKTIEIPVQFSLNEIKKHFDDSLI